jgi:hypothetical protein
MTIMEEKTVLKAALPRYYKFDSRFGALLQLDKDEDKKELKEKTDDVRRLAHEFWAAFKTRESVN